MAFTTIAGLTLSELDANGQIDYTGTFPNAKAVKSNLDLLQAARYGSLSGVLSGGVCTAAALVVTVPADTVIMVGGVVWENASAETKGVPDDDVSFVWFKSDGELDYTDAITTQPTGFEGSKSCLLCQATAASGVITLDNSVQHRARTADHTNRYIGENAGVFAPILDTLPADSVFVIPAGSQYNVIGDFYNYATLVNYGTLRIMGE